MKVVIAFTVLLLAASGFELADDISDEEFLTLLSSMSSEESIDVELRRGTREVFGVPNVYVSTHKNYASKRVHARHLKYFKKNLNNARAAINLAKSVVRSNKQYICSYYDARYKREANMRRMGIFVWCWNRLSLGDGTRIYKHNSSNSGIIFSGWML